MALIPCKQCDAEISDKAKVCPKCGQEDPIARKLKCSECENMIVPSTEGACPTCGNPDVLAEKPSTTEIISKNVSSNSEVHQKQSEAEPSDKKANIFPEIFESTQNTTDGCTEKQGISETQPIDHGLLLLGVPMAGIILMYSLPKISFFTGLITLVVFVVISGVIHNEVTDNRWFCYESSFIEKLI